VGAGALDLAQDEDVFEVITEPSDLPAVRAALEQAGVEVDSAEVVQRPKTRVPVGEEDARRLFRLIDALEESDDVNAVNANYDVPAEVMERVAG
jgi:transcriptional/translational regulatory protein YebC/TACO1